MVCLIKPQFEAGRDKVGKKGVVRDRKVHEEVLQSVTQMTSALGFTILGLDYSPVRGPEGNIEYLMYIQKPHDAHEPETTAETDTVRDNDLKITELVQASHSELDR